MNFSFPHVKAIYRQERNPKFRGNPYIEAIMDLPSDAQLATALNHFPKFDPAERELSAEYRIQRLDCLFDLVLALPRSIRLARAIFKMMRTGYAGRRPYSPADFQIMNELYAALQSGDLRSPSRQRFSSQHSLGLAGNSGAGKSYMLRRIAELLPPAIYHEQHGKWQLPFIFVEMAPDGESVHTLASEIHSEFDRLLPGDEYIRNYIERKNGTAMQRLASAFNIAYRHGVGAIVIDEKQNQRSLGNDETVRRRRGANLPRQETLLSKHLIAASNTSNIPLIMAGTLEMLNMLGARVTRGRRISGRGSATWLPLEPTFDLKAPGDFELLMMALWRYQWTRQQVRLGQGWLKLFYRLTQGIPDIMVKLYEATQERAISSGKEVMTHEMAMDEYRLQFAAVDFGITALRTRNPSRLPIVSDLYQEGVSPAKAPKMPGEPEVLTIEEAEQMKEPPTKGERGSYRPNGKLQQGTATPQPHRIPAHVLEGADLREAILTGDTPVGATE